jgi:hypothetical protein
MVSQLQALHADPRPTRVRRLTHALSRSQVTLISRRAVRRAGTRFNRRGIDRAGAVANFVETEQIVQVDGNYHLAYVQTRGSVPLFWGQTPTLRYKPPVELNTAEDHELAARRHFTEQLRHYGKQSVINLTNTTGHEGRLNRRCVNQLMPFLLLLANITS